MTTEEYINYCSHIINEGWNPDDPSNDDIDRMSDDYEKEQEEKEKLAKELEKSAGVKEAMSVDDILKKHQEKKDSAMQEKGDDHESNVKSVTFKEPPYEGYQNCTIEFKNGEKKDIEFDVERDEIDDMLAKLNKKCAERDFKKRPTDEDAIVAVIRLRLDPNDNFKWFFGEKKNVDLDKWFLNQEIENDMLDSKFNKRWEDKQKKWDMYAGSGDDTDPTDEKWTDTERHNTDTDDFTN